MSDYTIERGIPLPEKRKSGKGHGLARVLREMQPGESTLVKDRTQRNMATQACQAARSAADGRTYALRATDDGVRVWRVT
jgi:hypothetical protein